MKKTTAIQIVNTASLYSVVVGIVAILAKVPHPGRDDNDGVFLRFYDRCSH